VTKASAERIRLLVVDDSAVARRAVCKAVAADPRIEVVGTAADAYEARDRIIELNPDVITLDVHMPRMDGLSFLKILQQHHSVPVVILSSMTPAGSELALLALQAGAVDVVGKPSNEEAIAELSGRLIQCIRAAATTRGRVPALRTPGPAPAVPDYPGTDAATRLVVIGASTGGVEALRSLLPRLPANMPAILIAQHIPATFSSIMAQHLAALCRFPVREAVTGEMLHPGLALVAPGNRHLSVERTAKGYRVQVSDSPPVRHCRPSVDVLFRSAAESAGRNAVAALLTGMGNDGARGMQLLHAAGARTIAESEESSAIFGMPQAAIQLGVVERVVSLEEMPRTFIQLLREDSPR
jgi:two-component system, chemotaxis family, protein-glutamate methylesterase/glutaminase